MADVYTDSESEISPPVSWADVPSGAQSLLLVVDEPKECGPAIVHWIVYNIPANWDYLAEGAMHFAEESRHGPKVGLNDWANATWNGLDSKPGGLRFRLFALNKFLRFKTDPDLASILSAIEGHVLDSAEIHGLAR